MWATTVCFSCTPKRQPSCWSPRMRCWAKSCRCPIHQPHLLPPSHRATERVGRWGQVGTEGCFFRIWFYGSKARPQTGLFHHRPVFLMWHAEPRLDGVEASAGIFRIPTPSPPLFDFPANPSILDLCSLHADDTSQHTHFAVHLPVKVLSRTTLTAIEGR